MARLVVDGANVAVLLNPVEQFAAFRWRPSAPLASVNSVHVLDRSGPMVVQEWVSMGFAASTAPLAGVATVGPRAEDIHGRPAFVVSYCSGPAVLIRFDRTAHWGLWLISNRHAEAVATSILSSAEKSR
jgi:hypothetical protein